MKKKADLALKMARRQKRLEYWRQQLANAKLDEESRTQLAGIYSTYSLLLSKTLTTKEEKEEEECESRIESLERELVSFFEQYRLMTSDIGRAAIED